jgi:hypothetical protein
MGVRDRKAVSSPIPFCAIAKPGHGRRCPINGVRRPGKQLDEHARPEVIARGQGQRQPRWRSATLPRQTPRPAEMYASRRDDDPATRTRTGSALLTNDAPGSATDLLNYGAIGSGPSPAAIAAAARWMDFTMLWYPVQRQRLPSSQCLIVSGSGLGWSVSSALAERIMPGVQ